MFTPKPLARQQKLSQYSISNSGATIVIRNAHASKRTPNFYVSLAKEELYKELQVRTNVQN